MTKRLARVALLLFGFALVAHGGGIAISPLIVDITLPPGTTYRGTLTVTNTGETPVTLRAHALGFIAPQGIPIFLTPDLDRYPYSGRALVQVEPAEQEAGPGQNVFFTYTLTMPEVLEPFGGRYVAVVVQAVPKVVGEGQVVVATRVATLFLISPGPGAAPHFAIKNIRIYQSENNPREVILEADIQNDGNLHVSRDQIIGWIYITDADGYLIDVFQAETHTMLPDNEYLHREVWTAPSDLLPGTYQFHLDLWVFGPLGQKSQQYFISLPVELKF